jgi:hypothetical protein
MALNQGLLLLRRDRVPIGFGQDALAKNRNSKQTQQQQATAVATDGRLHAKTVQVHALWRGCPRNSDANSHQA